MATRFDRVTTTTRMSEPDFEVDFATTALTKAELALLTVRAVPGEARTIAPGELGGAMIAWLSIVFALCYVLVPTALYAVLQVPSIVVLFNLWYLVPSFVLAGFVAWVAALVARPTVRLDGPRDPVIAASVGGMGVLVLAENLVPAFVPFSEMSTAYLACFLALNALEMTLLGMMFASFTRRPLVAFALGAGFQLLSLGLQLTVLSAAL